MKFIKWEFYDNHFTWIAQTTLFCVGCWLNTIHNTSYWLKWLMCLVRATSCNEETQYDLWWYSFLCVICLSRLTYRDHFLIRLSICVNLTDYIITVYMYMTDFCRYTHVVYIFTSYFLVLQEYTYYTLFHISKVFDALAYHKDCRSSCPQLMVWVYRMKKRNSSTPSFWFRLEHQFLARLG